MNKMRLLVIEGDGIPRAIELEARNSSDARQQAAAMGLDVLSCKPLRGRWVRLERMSNDSRGQSLDVVIFVEQLRDLLTAGLSLIEALDALLRGANGASAATLERLSRRLREGQTLSDALASDSLFPPLLTALVRASELTSDLPQTLARFLEHERRIAEVRHRLTSTAIYPLLLTAVGSLVLLFLLLYVMPRFARVFEGMTGTLPWSARAMVAWSRWLSGLGGWWLAALGAAGAAALGFLCVPEVRAKAANRALSWAPLRSRLTTYFLSRWYRATGMLVQGGIPLSQALQLSNAVLPKAMEAGGRAVILAVNEGLSPSAAHVQAGMATPVAEQLLLAGERTGDLGSVLTRIAHFHESEVSRSLDRVLRIIEPVAMVAIGLGVGLVVVLMYMPIFELASAIQ